jgi:hypothetical protein
MVMTVFTTAGCLKFASAETLGKEKDGGYGCGTIATSVVLDM